MFSALGSALDRLAPVARDWCFLLAGVAILASAVLLPPWMQNRRLAWERDLLRAQAQAMSAKRLDYERFAQALAQDDPTLLQRVAFHYLRLKPVGAVPVFGLTPGSHPSAEPQTIDDWLARPIPTAGHGFPDFSPIESRLTRALSSGPQRWAATALGALCLALAIAPRLGFRAVR
jgi:hypothetical protein